MQIINFDQFDPPEGVFYVAVRGDDFFEAEEKIVVNLVRPNILEDLPPFVPVNTDPAPVRILVVPEDSRIKFNLDQTAITIRGGI